jgi:hypothetical protein
MTRPTRIRVGQLVVSGLPPAAARRAAAAFEGELARLAAEGNDVAMQAAQGPLRLRITAGDPQQIGVAAARSLHTRMRRGEP